MIHVSKGVLTVGISLFGGFAVPLYGLDIVLGHASAVVIHRTQPPLRFRIPVFRPDTVCCRPLRELTILMLNANDDACANQSHAGDGHDHPASLHRAPPYRDGIGDYTSFGHESL